MCPSDITKSPADLVGGSHHSQSVENVSGSSSNQVSEVAGARNALLVAMHIKMAKLVQYHFSTLFKYAISSDAFVELDDLQPKLSLEDTINLTMPFTKDEVERALFDMNPNKTHGPWDVKVFFSKQNGLFSSKIL
ncbi:hypothetical protein Scep_013964 [Stephania cephalantha]|uniref:Uncharacterized protein n=1 Tax=Stephania cephalantha TaxID=152367 RepID=A0AAP0J273_9MAGN